MYEEQAERFNASPQEAAELLSVGKKKVTSDLNQTKTAALTVVANTMLNHDEAYMKR